MNNFEYIFKYNSRKPKKRNRIGLENKKVICKIYYSSFGAGVINQVIDFVNSLNPILKGFPIVFEFCKKIALTDKLSYILFECICYYLIEKGYIVYVHMRCFDNIQTRGIKCAPLNLLSVGDCAKFEKKFKFEIYGNHFCKLITQEHASDPAYLSYLYGDIDNFLRNVGVNDDSSKTELSQTISELIGNAIEHTKSDCYIDIDIATGYYKLDSNSNLDKSSMYHGINIVILNLSDNLLNSDLKNKIRNNKDVQDRYKRLRDAYVYHKNFFGSDYSEDDFFNIAVFQNKISGSSSINKMTCGGTGLTCLINSLQEKSDSDNCYVLSGSNIIYFIKEYLSYNEDWIGFNKSNDFFNDIPEKKVIDKSEMFFSGTAYNLNFVMKSEDNNE